jgi:hypothetical protein
MADAKLFQYYERQDVLPTFGNFKSPAELARYAAQRRELFLDKLLLPPRLFHAAEVLEFGPDSGENALVFAGWGVNMTLAEPNKHAHDKINAYFARFSATDRLREIALADVEGFRNERQFDIIDAEGFIYTIQPTQTWLRIFHDLLNPDGYAIISYYERSGGFFELAFKAIHAAAKAMTGLPAHDTATLVFEAKWNSIPHTRSFESWLMDVLENPFVRHRYFLDAATLCREADANGFASHSAWPSYRDTLDVYWHKKVHSADEKLQRTVQHLCRSRLSFLSGQKLYLVGENRSVDLISSSLEQLAGDVDALIDDPFGARLSSCITQIKSLRTAVASADVLADDSSVIKEFDDTLVTFSRIFDAIARRDVDDLATLTRTETPFIRAWGQPAHFLVLRKRLDLPR